MRKVEQYTPKSEKYKNKKWQSTFLLFYCSTFLVVRMTPARWRLAPRAIDLANHLATHAATHQATHCSEPPSEPPSDPSGDPPGDPPGD